MRTWALLIVVLFTAVSAVAADQSNAIRTPMPPERPDLAVLSGGASIDGASLIRPATPDGACLKMRTYVMKREGIGDSTRLVKYYTCQNASKYTVKKAEQPSAKQPAKDRP